MNEDEADGGDSGGLRHDGKTAYGYHSEYLGSGCRLLGSRRATYGLARRSAMRPWVFRSGRIERVNDGRMVRWAARSAPGGGMSCKCADGDDVTLATPPGDRIVIDDSTGEQVEVAPLED